MSSLLRALCACKGRDTSPPSSWSIVATAATGGSLRFGPRGRGVRLEDCLPDAGFRRNAHLYLALREHARTEIAFARIKYPSVPT
jgi:hypothetical protein